MTRFSTMHMRPQSSFMLCVCLFCCLASACAGSHRDEHSEVAPSEARPEITPEKIKKDIVGRRVRRVPAEDGTSETINWTFNRNEPKEFTVLEKQVEGDKAVVVLEMKTSDAPGSRNPRSLSGKLRLHYELQTGWVIRRWEIVEVENLTMRYKKES